MARAASTTKGSAKTKAPESIEESYETPLISNNAPTAVSGGDAPDRQHADQAHGERITRLEEWSKISDYRTNILDGKVSGMSEGASDLRANMLTREAFDARRREDRSFSMVVAGLVVAVLALLFAGYQIWGPKASSPVPAPAPIVIQLPAAATVLPAPQHK